MPILKNTYFAECLRTASSPFNWPICSQYTVSLPLKTSENVWVFLCFQGVVKGAVGTNRLIIENLFCKTFSRMGQSQIYSAESLPRKLASTKSVLVASSFEHITLKGKSFEIVCKVKNKS